MIKSIKLEHQFEDLKIILFNYFCSKNQKVCINIFNDYIYSSDYDTIYILPLKATYKLKHIKKYNGYHEILEINSECINYYIKIDGQYENISKQDIFKYNELKIFSQKDLNNIENVIKKTVVNVYNFFDKFNIKLNSIQIKFAKVNDSEFVLLIDIEKDTFSLMDSTESTKVNLEDILLNFEI